MYEFKRILRSLGIVFGDIGTSPIYTVTIIFLITSESVMHLPRTEENIMGVLSLIFWTLTVLVTLEYAWLAMSLGKEGEGGTIVLKEILVKMLKSKKQIAFVLFLTIIGVSLLIGDGVITPAISILSAVEGMLLIPGMEDTTQLTLIIIASIIAIILFSFQKGGTEKVGKYFGPMMVLWFLSLALSGLISIVHHPSVLMAINPYYIVKFFMNNGFHGFIVLTEVILCATGGEALYADMGHLGRKPIIRAWIIVFVALVLNYYGQGAFLMQHPESKQVLFEMVFNEYRILYVPFLILSVIATVIASQAMISGMFSIVYQGITTHIMPMLKVDYTSTEMRSQIYIGSVNWFLLFFVIVMMFVFKESSNLGAAYGLAVTGTMSFTGIFMTWIFYLKKHYVKCGISVFITIVDLIFFTSNSYKIPHGGYWSIIIAAIPLFLILIYTYGQRKLYFHLKPMNLKHFIKNYRKMCEISPKLPGTALFFARDINKIPRYITGTMFTNGIIYEDTVMVSIEKHNEPFGISFNFENNITEGVRYFRIKVGYMEVLEVEEILKKAGISEKVIFYGLEDIQTDNIIWKIFAFIKNITPSFVQFYRLPSGKLHGVITRYEF